MARISYGSTSVAMKARTRGRLIVAFLFVLGLCASLGHAQNREGQYGPRPAWGIFGTHLVNQHHSDFRQLPGTPSCCPKYESGVGTGFSGGLIYDMPLATEWLLSLRLSYASQSATLTNIEKSLVSYGRTSLQAEINHSLEANLSSFGPEALLGYRVFDEGLVMLGFRMGFVTESRYYQEERLVQPRDFGTFENGRRIRNEESGEIRNASGVLFSAMLGVSAQFIINESRTLALVPEVFYSLGLSPVVSNYTWRADAIYTGAAIKYSPFPSGEEPPEPIAVEPFDEEPAEEEEGDVIPPPAPPVADIATAAIVATGVDPFGNEYPLTSLTLQEMTMRESRPVLNYVFFAENSSTLPDRYTLLTVDETRSFDPDKLNTTNTLDLYHQVLNVVGRRMLDNPKATLTIVGCNADTGPEQRNLKLSGERAQRVRDYLERVWGVQRHRLKIEKRGLPEKASSSEDPDGIAENRRVELYSESRAIFEPVVTQGYLREIVPPTVRFKTLVEAPAGIDRWNVGVFSNVGEHANFKGYDSVPSDIDWPVEPAEKFHENPPSALYYNLSGADGLQRPFASEIDTLPVEVLSAGDEPSDQNRGRIERYSLILYDFGKIELNPENQRIVDGIKASISETSNISVSGFTDRIGDEDYNQNLSEVRAKMVARILDRPEHTRVVGFGENRLLFDNELPEGRYYSRSVNVLIESYPR